MILSVPNHRSWFVCLHCWTVAVPPTRSTYVLCRGRGFWPLGWNIPALQSMHAWLMEWVMASCP